MMNIFSFEPSFDFWCLPGVLTRIIKLIYSPIRNWSLNWWIFKAIKHQHVLINFTSHCETCHDNNTQLYKLQLYNSNSDFSFITKETRCKQSQYNKYNWWMGKGYLIHLGTNKRHNSQFTYTGFLVESMQNINKIFIIGSKKCLQFSWLKSFFLQTTI